MNLMTSFDVLKGDVLRWSLPSFKNPSFAFFLHTRPTIICLVLGYHHELPVIRFLYSTPEGSSSRGWFYSSPFDSLSLFCSRLLQPWRLLHVFPLLLRSDTVSRLFADSPYAPLYLSFTRIAGQSSRNRPVLEQLHK